MDIDGIGLCNDHSLADRTKSDAVGHIDDRAWPLAGSSSRSRHELDRSRCHDLQCQREFLLLALQTGHEMESYWVVEMDLCVLLSSLS